MKRVVTALLLLLALHGTANATLSIDGSATNAATTVTLSTSNSNDVIIVWAKYTGGSVSGVTSTHLTFTKRYSSGISPVGVGADLWYAIASSPLSSEVITVSGISGGQRNTAFGISGANTSTPFDSNSSLPASSASSAGSSPQAVTISTSSANDMLISGLTGQGGSGFGTVTRASGFSQIISTGTSQDIADSVVSSTQSSVSESFSWTGTATGFLVVDAIQQASSSPTPENVLMGIP